MEILIAVVIGAAVVAAALGAARSSRRRGDVIASRSVGRGEVTEAEPRR